MSSNTAVESYEKSTEQILLKSKLRRSQRLQNIKSMALVSPLFLFTLIVFLVPVLLLLARSIDNPEVQSVWPNTAEAIEQWSGSSLPEDNIFYLVAKDIQTAKKNKDLVAVSKRLNYEMSGMRSMINRTARTLSKVNLSIEKDIKQKLISIDTRWGELATWHAIKRAAPSLTSHYLLAALDYTVNDEGSIVSVTEDKAIYKSIFVRTLWISFVVTFICLIIGYPIAHFIANSEKKWSGILMIALLLPFWTSLLVRTSAWMVLLQKNGVVNTMLMDVSLITQPLDMLYDRPAVYIAMVHLLLPFMVLSLYSVMKSISPVYMKAALSLGAHPVVAFVRVYIPQTLPGVAAGGLLCFILALGYYITPSLVGGADDQMIGYFIAYYTNQVINWGMASALGILLMIVSGILFIIYIKLWRC
ncbi:ABC transporter permease [Vibrio sp. 10N.261.55.A7]|uniref:ABC transporter permease n=1 Tax=Vibrio sp. 10N.261.55.A7 TaxID=1880851 RepID=UPI000C8430FB|nr:ABC transporter permease [Vibrio sp. 10N.261.55.A7]PMJ99982.1 ABC transporter permease [Vibrio sp. 10N.261.55.A7]